MRPFRNEAGTAPQRRGRGRAAGAPRHVYGAVTDALDLAVITPSTVLAGLLVLRRTAVGFAIAIPLFVLEAFLLPMIAAQTVSQIEAGVAFSVPEIIGPIGGFVALAGLSLWALVAILRRAPRSCGAVTEEGRCLGDGITRFNSSNRVSRSLCAI